MVVLLVVLSIIVFVAIDYLIQRKKKQSLASQPGAEKLTISKIFHMLPAGVFLQPSFTWSKILDTGNLFVGIHPVLMGLIGEPDKTEMLQQGQEIRKGDTILTLHKGQKVMHVKAPLDGTVVSINPDIDENGSWEKLSHTWLYGIKPVNVADEVPGWLIAEKSREWLNDRYQQMKSFFAQSSPQSQLGYTMADGGDLPIGILSKFESKTWQDFEEKFLN